MGYSAAPHRDAADSTPLPTQLAAALHVWSLPSPLSFSPTQSHCTHCRLPSCLSRSLLSQPQSASVSLSQPQSASVSLAAHTAGSPRVTPVSILTACRRHT